MLVLIFINYTIILLTFWFLIYLTQYASETFSKQKIYIGTKQNITKIGINRPCTFAFVFDAFFIDESTGFHFFDQ